MRALAIVRFVAVLSGGLIAGILLGDRMGASFARPALSPSSFVRFQQIQHSHFVVMMPILLGIVILSGAAWLTLLRPHRRNRELALLALAVLAFISVAALTRAVNVPINDQLMAWNASSPPSDVMEIWARWEWAHTVRTVIAVVGFSLEVLVLGTAKNSPAAQPIFRPRPLPSGSLSMPDSPASVVQHSGDRNKA